MGFFSSLFGNKSGNKKGVIRSGKDSSWAYANRFNRAKGGHAGGYGAITFGNIMNAHCTADDIIEEFELDQEGCKYEHPYFRTNCWEKAYREQLMIATIEAAFMAAIGIYIDPEDLINWDEVEANAYEYAEELADMYINGSVWIPTDILNWAYFEVSDHNDGSDYARY